MKKFFDLFKLRSGRLLGLSIACIVSGTLFSYNNCGEVYKAKQSFRISSSCSQEKVVSLEERDQLLSRYHSPSDKQSRLRCPGFFAVLDDDAQYSVAQNKMAKATDGCNQNGLPQEPELPEPSDNKDEWIRAALGKTRPGNIETWVKKMSDGSLWPTRYHASSTNNKVAEWIKSEFETLAGNRSDIRIELIDHSNTPQKSVEVMIEGSGQNRDKYVVLGG
ncbi:MAG: hypothetical protein KDD35_10655, partial [Bdellovibrionales bacterium]|nr:hypothetical protein [Bdellovibrionales bacterium]